VKDLCSGGSKALAVSKRDRVSEAIPSKWGENWSSRNLVPLLWWRVANALRKTLRSMTR
jgi:hypothetical protein